MTGDPTSPLPYHHRQPGWLTLGVFLLAGLLVLLPILGSARPLDGGARWMLLLVGLILVASLVVFSSLTVVVRDGELRWHFGPGWPRWRVSLADVVSAEPARTAWWWGFGIRLTPYGWLYTVSGRDAVLVRRRDGRAFLLGTDEPARLAHAIRSALA